MAENTGQYQKGGETMAKEEFYDDVGAQMELSGLVKDQDEVDPVSGNEIPLGSTAKGVRDDETAAISAGEFVIPDYAVRYHGVDFYMQSLKVAKKGLQQMDEMGMTGKPDQVSISDDRPLPTMEDEEPAPMLDKPIDTEMFAHGGLHTGNPGGVFINPAQYFTSQQPSFVPPQTAFPQPGQQGAYPTSSIVPQVQAPTGVAQVVRPVSSQPLPATYDPNVTPPTYTEYQGPGAGVPGGYGIKAYKNPKTGKVIYLTTIGGELPAGTQIPAGFVPIEEAEAVTPPAPPEVPTIEVEEEDSDDEQREREEEAQQRFEIFQNLNIPDFISTEGPSGVSSVGPPIGTRKAFVLPDKTIQGNLIKDTLPASIFSGSPLAEGAGQLAEFMLPGALFRIGKSYAGAIALSRERETIYTSQVGKVENVGKVDFGENSFGVVTFLASGVTKDDKPIISAFDRDGKSISTDLAVQAIALAGGYDPTNTTSENLQFDTVGNLAGITSDRMPFQYYNTAIADSYQERPAGVSKYVGGITADGRILKWDTDDGEWESKRVGKRTFESLSQAEQEHLIYANKDEKGFFTGKPIVRDHWKVKQADGTISTVGEIRAAVILAEDESLEPEPAPEPEPERPLPAPIEKTLEERAEERLYRQYLADTGTPLPPPPKATPSPPPPEPEPEPEPAPEPDSIPWRGATPGYGLNKGGLVKKPKKKKTRKNGKGLAKRK